MDEWYVARTCESRINEVVRGRIRVVGEGVVPTTEKCRTCIPCRLVVDAVVGEVALVSVWLTMDLV